MKYVIIIITSGLCLMPFCVHAQTGTAWQNDDNEDYKPVVAATKPYFDSQDRAVTKPCYTDNCDDQKVDRDSAPQIGNSFRQSGTPQGSLSSVAAGRLKTR